MRRSRSIPTALAAVAIAAGCAAAAAAADRRDLTESHGLEGGQEVRVDFHSGELRIEPGAAGRVAIELSVECRWSSGDCGELLDDVRIDWRPTSRRLVLEVEGIRSWQRPQLEVEALVTVPAAVPLEVEMAAGRLEVESHAADLRVDMAAGEARLRLPKDAVRTIFLDVGVGEATLHGSGTWVSGRRSMLVGSELYWDQGPGEARVDVEMVAGEASVWLE